MRIGNILWTITVAALAAAGLPFKAAALGSADGVAIQYYFAGAADLAGNTNFNQAKEFLITPPAKHFQDFVLDRLAQIYWKAFQFDPGGNSTTTLRPMLHDLLKAESTGSFGGRTASRMDFVVAARLDASRAAAWQKNLETALHGKGEPLTDAGFSGQRWSRPNNDSFWIMRAGDWTVVGRGEDLLPVRADYLQNLKQENRPAPVMKESWLSASVDWPLLDSWAPMTHSPLKLARTIVDVTASNGKMRATAYVSYPEAVAWEPEPWRIPKGLVSSPLSSFTAARNVAPYLNFNELLSRLPTNPFAAELFCWGLREKMPLHTYAAWPVTDATNLMRKLGKEAPTLLNPILEARNHTQLSWLTNLNQILWNHLQLTAPILEAVHDESGDFLEAKIFPPQQEVKPAPDQLWSQFEGRDDLVYYDWEVTGLRLVQWRLLTEVLPVFPPSSRLPDHPQKNGPKAKAGSSAEQTPISLIVTEAWLASLMLPPGNSVTEVTRTSPTELTIVRNAQFLFTGLEWVLLSHWLADAPVGPVDYKLLPMPEISGPGIPRPPGASARPAPRPPAKTNSPDSAH